MSKRNKYDYRITQSNSSWSAEIIRRVTSKKSIVSKSQDGFSNEEEAKNWGEKELKAFQLNQKDRNQRHSSKRQQKAERIKTKAEANSKHKEH